MVSEGIDVSVGSIELTVFLDDGQLLVLARPTGVDVTSQYRATPLIVKAMERIREETPPSDKNYLVTVLKEELLKGKTISPYSQRWKTLIECSITQYAAARALRPNASAELTQGLEMIVEAANAIHPSSKKIDVMRYFQKAAFFFRGYDAAREELEPVFRQAVQAAKSNFLQNGEEKYASQITPLVEMVAYFSTMLAAPNLREQNLADMRTALAKIKSYSELAKSD